MCTFHDDLFCEIKLYSVVNDKSEIKRVFLIKSAALIISVKGKRPLGFLPIDHPLHLVESSECCLARRATFISLISFIQEPIKGKKSSVEISHSALKSA